jgi:hypothetical protein
MSYKHPLPTAIDSLSPLNRPRSNAPGCKECAQIGAYIDMQKSGTLPINGVLYQIWRCPRCGREVAWNG